MRSFHRSLVVLLLLAMFTLLLVGCGGSAPEVEPEPAATEAPAKEEEPAATEAPAEEEEPAATEAPAEEEEPAEEADGEIIIGLITKTETNPFFVKMKEGAEEAAAANGATLLTAAGSFDGDNESQVTAIENMVNAGAQGILITPSDTSAIVPAIEKARAEGVVVIALDTPTDPEDATDALFATDNYKAGVLIGEYARSIMGDDPVEIATLDLAPGITVGQLRHDGFLDGYGIEEGDPQVVCSQDTQGDQAKGQTAMENCLQANPDINVVYTINEPAAFGAYTALEAVGRENDVLIVSVDGGCAGVEGIVSGQIGATSQQYPLKMASLGVETIVEYAKTGNAPSGYTDTGVTLITNNPQDGIESENAVFGVESCWGEPSEGALEAAQESVAAAGSGDSGDAMGDEEIIVGLITKTETNPFFVKMKEGAEKAAAEQGVTLLTAAGSFDGDNESQVTAIENMVNAGAKGILITASDTAAIVPAIEKARAEGVVVIALDTPLDPEDATDALFATDNYKAGVLIGEYARSVMGDDPVEIATLDLAPGITVGQLRHDGFLDGYGIDADDPQVVCQQDTQGDQAKGQTAMENCLQANPDINVVYTINEPAAFGAYTALEAVGRENDVLIVSVDGGCAGVEGIVSGQIGATSQQYPLKMASLGLEAIVEYAKTGNAPSGYTDTGVTLITNNPQDGIESENAVFGIESCWGDPSEGALEAAEESVAAAGDSGDSGDSGDAMGDEEIIIGLITKTETNPFFVKMKEGAEEAAAAQGATLLTASGNFDGDNESQVTAIENMVNAGAQGILITPSDTAAIVPAIEKARAEGVVVIALDTPTDPEDATDALFATDNYQAGILIGQYARSVMGDDPVEIATLDLAPGITVGQLRHDGFLDGYGIEADDPQVVCQQDTQGDQAKGQTAMENCLQANPDINVVYTINEPAAFGAYTALEAVGRENDVLIVSVDGGCAGVEGIVSGQIGATSQQYPLKMASLGVDAIVEYAKTGNAPSGYTDTGVTLITNNPQDGIESENAVFGVESCWGEPSEGALEAAEESVAAAGDSGAEVSGDASGAIIGLITKTETNPFFVKMKEGAEEAAAKYGATLLTAAGSFDGDNESQVTAIENMVNAGAQGILITASDTAAIVPAIEKARAEGVVVIALDTPLDPEDATDALFATDNYQAGILIGQYARAVMGDDPVEIATLDLAPGITVGQLRHDGFLEGYGIEADDPQVVCQQDTQGDQAKGQTAMENCLQANPDINVVYTINEPAAFGAYTALEAVGRENEVLIVSVDGGCAGVEGIVSGQIGATSQQYPLKMASLGVDAIVEYFLTGEAPSGYTDTGVTLITDNPQDGIDSEDTTFGLDSCWGE